MSDAKGSGYGPAVVDGLMRYTSVSAINKFATCNRAWFFRYVARLPDEPATRAMLFGVGAHGRIEHYLKTGEDMLGELERTGLPFMPTPKSPFLTIEGKVQEGNPLTGADVPLKGGMDLAEHIFEERGVLVTDWKFKSDIGRYGTTKAKLLDPNDDDGRQMIGYAEWVRRNAIGIDWIQVRHVSFNTGGIDDQMQPKGPFKAKETRSERVPLDVVKQLWDKVSRFQIESMKVAAAAKTYAEVKPNTSVCRKYHRDCPYLAQCPEGQGSIGTLLAPKYPPKAPKETTNVMSMLSKMKNLNSAAPTTPSPAAPETTPAAPAPSEAPLRIFDIGATYRLRDGETGVLESIAGNAGRFKVGRGSAVSFRDTLLTSIGEQVQTVTPPDEPAPSEPVQAEPIQNSIGETAPEAPKKRGRPSKAKASETAVEAPKTEAEPTPVKEHHAEAGGLKMLAIDLTNLESSSTAPAGTYLYYVGAPVGVPTQTLHAYVEGLDLSARKAFGIDGQVPDVRLAETDGLKFGKWKTVLALAAKESPPAPGHYIVTRGDDRVEAVADALASVAAPGTVVR